MYTCEYLIFGVCPAVAQGGIVDEPQVGNTVRFDVGMLRVLRAARTGRPAPSLAARMTLPNPDSPGDRRGRPALRIVSFHGQTQDEEVARDVAAQAPRRRHAERWSPRATLALIVSVALVFWGVAFSSLGSSVLWIAAAFVAGVAILSIAARRAHTENE